MFVITHNIAPGKKDVRRKLRIKAYKTKALHKRGNNNHITKISKSQCGIKYEYINNII